MAIGALLHELQGKIIHQRLEPGRKGIYRAVPASLHSSIRLYSRFEYPQGLYAHQSACIESVLAGQDTAICTSTASGKSVAFSFPTMHELLRNHEARALFVYPMKALANDQIIKLQGLAKSLGLNPGIVRKFDGDVHGKDRQDALEHGRLLVVTPDVLHTTILRENGQSLYGELFQHLTLVILDECHVYSGVFGSNMAYVVRRLRQVCRRHGSDPRFIMASATVGNPYEHFSKLTGLENIKILGQDNDGSPRFDRHFYLVEPPEYVDAYLLRVIAELARKRIRFLVFGQTRQQVERITEQLRLKTPEVGSRVEAYRAGLNADDRLHIEKAFRHNQLSGLIATSALELGVDLPDLAVCILVGLPGTKASFLQQAGRIGRHEEGHVIVLRTESAYDNYYFRNPERLFSKPLEPLAVNLDNEPLMIAHYACARVESGHFEAPDLDGDVFGGNFARLAGKVRDFDFPDEILYVKEPHFEVNIRCLNDPSYRIIAGFDPTDPPIGTLTYSQLLREAYPQAVYLQRGKRYKVTGMSYTKKVVFVDARCSLYMHTKPRAEVYIKERYRSGGAMKLWKSGIALKQTSLGIMEKVLGCRIQSGNERQEVIYAQPLMRHFVTDGIALSLKGMTHISYAAVVGLATALENAFPMGYSCAKEDIVSYAWTNSDEARIYLYDNSSGGLALTWAALDKMDGGVTLDEIKQGVPVIAAGSTIALRSGQRGTILGWRLENSQVIYEAKLDSGKTIALRNTGGNIALVQGEQSIVCLGCGADGIAEDAFECPVCGDVLR